MKEKTNRRGSVRRDANGDARDRFTAHQTDRREEDDGGGEGARDEGGRLDEAGGGSILGYRDDLFRYAPTCGQRPPQRECCAVAREQ